MIQSLNKQSFLVFISLLLLVASGYLYLEVFRGGSKVSEEKAVKTEKLNSAPNSAVGGTRSVRLMASEGHYYEFTLPEEWKADISPFSPPGSPAVNQGFRIDLVQGEKGLNYSWYSPIKYHFYLGEVGKYLSQQRAPLTPLALLESFFGHQPDSCQRIDKPSKNWNRRKNHPVEHYSEVLTEWYKVEGRAQPIYYYIKIEKAPTPGVYGDLGSWTFSGFRFEIPAGEKLSEKNMKPAQIFYRTLKEIKEDKSPSKS